MTRQRSAPMATMVAAAQALVALRQRHAVAVEHDALEKVLQPCLVQPMTPVERAARLHVVGVAVERGEVGGEPFAVRHPRTKSPLLGDPAGVAGVVRVEMRHDQPGDRPPAQHLGPDRADQLADALAAVAAIDHGPAVAVAKQPQVDLLQSDERHRRGDPEDAVGHLGRGAGRRIVGEREFQAVDDGQAGGL